MRSDLTPGEALAAVLEHTRVLGSERVALPDAQARILAEEVSSERCIPPADNSAMDGFAVRRADLVGAAPGAAISLPVTFEIPAGTATPATLARGTAARILTGAPVPPGADAVVRQEDTERTGDTVAIRVEPAEAEHIRPAGEDVQVGDVVLEAGTRIGPAEIGILAALGRGFIPVIQRPRVAILSGGDELVEPDGDIAGGRIVSSNSYTIAAACRELGAEPVYLGIAGDTPDDIETHLRAGLNADVLVSSAGVSVGDRDYVRPVLEKIGCELVFWGVKMKPGYPLAFGRFPGERGPLMFGLPGNPVSAMMTFEQFARPALLHMLGAQSLHRPLIDVRVGEPLTKKPGRMHFVRVTLSRVGSDIVALPTGNQSSGVLRSMVEAQAILLFPAESAELGKGETAKAQLLDPAFLDAKSPGFA